MVYDGFTGGLSANPIEDITHRTGTTALVLLLVTLGVSPIKRWTAIGALIALRRPLGLFAFFYGTLHFLTYLVLDQFFAWGFIVEDIMDRPYITVGFTALVLLIPLAVTSTKGWIKRLGAKRWNTLHRLVYLSAAGGVLHFLWLVKADTRKPIVFGVILVGLLATRLQRRSGRKRSVPAQSRPATLEAAAGSE
jgi:sulfoxide reductase heme-binding subunit YedZ